MVFSAVLEVALPTPVRTPRVADEPVRGVISIDVLARASADNDDNVIDLVVAVWPHNQV